MAAACTITLRIITLTLVGVAICLTLGGPGLLTQDSCPAKPFHSVTSHLARCRNFNDFAADVNASTLLFVTPNDDHNTAVECAGQWVDYWPASLPDDTNTNAEHTLIFLTIDETGTCAVNNCILTRGAVPKSARRTVDSTYYRLYSSLSTVEYYVPITAPNTSAVGAGGGVVFVASVVDTSFTTASASAPVNLTAQGKTVPWLGPRVAAASPSSSPVAAAMARRASGRAWSRWCSGRFWWAS
ncbi:hypothetical protein EDB86DRAFT_2831420 [Lactarius hatsudake]|nr:hypothetical protein EDB86DRAFT_2831420 [Lactarius hatsudake]